MAMAKLSELPYEDFFYGHLIRRESDQKSLEEIADIIIDKVKSYSNVEELQRLCRDLEGSFSRCVENDSIYDCIWLLSDVWKFLHGKRVSYKVYDLYIRKVGTDLFHVIVTDIEDDCPETVHELYLKAEGDVDKEAVVRNVVQILREKTKDHYYSVFELKPLVEKVWRVLKEKVG